MAFRAVSAAAVTVPAVIIGNQPNGSTLFSFYGLDDQKLSLPASTKLLLVSRSDDLGSGRIGSKPKQRGAQRQPSGAEAVRSSTFHRSASLARSRPRTSAPHALQVRFVSKIVAEEMMDSIEQRKSTASTSARGPRDAADAGENIVELLLDIALLSLVGGELAVFRALEDGPFVAKNARSTCRAAVC
jgi:hypothetical protein